MARPGQYHHRAFTLIEMIVVVSIIAILIALLLPSLSGARRNSKSTQSRSNMRQIHVGLTSFANINKERFMSPCTEVEYLVDGEVMRRKAWVNASDANLVPDPDGDNLIRETTAALEEGWAFEYVGAGDVYVSPLDPTGRVRSYSLNGILSEDPDPYYAERFMAPSNPDGPPQPPAATMTNIAHPDQMMHIIPEDFDPPNYQHGDFGVGGYNYYGFLIDPVDPVWTDLPAFFVDDGINLAYIDGHVEFHRYTVYPGSGPGDPSYELHDVLRDYRQVLPGPNYDFFKSILMPGMERRMGLPDPVPPPAP